VSWLLFVCKSLWWKDEGGELGDEGFGGKTESEMVMLVLVNYCATEAVRVCTGVTMLGV
jgi:hypothetical protein